MGKRGLDRPKRRKDRLLLAARLVLQQQQKHQLLPLLSVQTQAVKASQLWSGHAIGRIL